MFAKLGQDKLKKKRNAGKNDIKKLFKDAKNSFPNFVHIESNFDKKGSKLEVYTIEKYHEIYTCDNVPFLFKIPVMKNDKPSEQVFPHLQYVLEYPDLIKCVYVDEGAVKPLLNGANLKAPGIKQTPVPFEKYEPIAVRLLEQEAAFALGYAVVSSSEINSSTKGDGVIIVHLLKDGLWDIRKGV